MPIWVGTAFSRPSGNSWLPNNKLGPLSDGTKGESKGDHQGPPKLPCTALGPSYSEPPHPPCRLPAPSLRETGQCFSRAAKHPQPAGKVPMSSEPTARAGTRAPR